MAIRTPHTIDEYIATFPPGVQQLLNEVREAVKQAAPTAIEAIKYGMPTFILHGNLVHFAAYKKHIGFYPVPIGVAEFEKDIATYKTGKGSIQLPLDRPMPLNLITKMVQYRVNKNLANKASNSNK
jgi:uncharacterized protein YdhG (YjbR/CyaY superfamily)